MSGTGAPSMGLKLKINTSQAAHVPVSATPTPSTGLKLSFKPLGTPTAATPATPGATAKRKYTKKDKNTPKSASKKRVRDDDEDELAGPTIAPKKQALGLKLSKADSSSAPLTPGIIKLKTPSSIRPNPFGVPRLKIKHKGKPPVRPLGAGYDSEASDAEVDPAIEENFVLRMAPGPDCDYLRQAIIDGKIGAKLSEGGANVALKFFSRDGRRACVTIQNRHYAAILVDLPCIVESMKSWDKRGWWKSADICQMLVVLPGIVKKEEEAKTKPIPKDWGVDEKLWQWPHGLTPPMRMCRTRRFRKRVSHRTIEKAEEEVERLLALDEKAKASKNGKSQYEIVDLDRMKSAEVDSQDEGEDGEGDYDEEDGEGEIDVEYGNGETVDADDDDEIDHIALAAQMEQALEADEDEEEENGVATNPASPAFQSSVTAPATPIADASAATPAAEEAVSAAVSEDGGEEVEAEAEGDAEEEEEDDDDDDDDDELDEDADEETRERAHLMTQTREEIAHLEHEIASAREQLGRQTNPLFRQRIASKIKSLEADRDVKKKMLGTGGDDDDEDDA